MLQGDRNSGDLYQYNDLSGIYGILYFSSMEGNLGMFAHMERAIRNGAKLEVDHSSRGFIVALVDYMGTRHATENQVLETALDSLDQLCAMDDPRVILSSGGDRYTVQNHQGIDVGQIVAVEGGDDSPLFWEVHFYYVGFVGINGGDRLIAPMKPDQPVGIGIRYLLSWADNS